MGIPTRTKIEKLKVPQAITGDDLGIETMRYEDVPEGYRLADITIDSDLHPLSYLAKERLVTAADRFYKKHEIVGETLGDFADNLQMLWEVNADTVERVLQVYNDDIAKPILGRTRTVTYDVTDNSLNWVNGETTEINVPIDSPANDQPSAKTKNSGNGSGQVKRTGTETEELSDLGVRPNYESLNGFIDNNKSIERIFINAFKDAFTLNEGIKW